MRYALVDSSTGRVCDIVMPKDGGPPYKVAAPFLLVEFDETTQAVVPDQQTWDGAAFVDPPEPQPPTQEEVNEASICTHLDTEITALKQFRTRLGNNWTNLDNSTKDALIARLLRDVEYLCRIARRKLNET